MIAESWLPLVVLPCPFPLVCDGVNFRPAEVSYRDTVHNVLLEPITGC